MWHSQRSVLYQPSEVRPAQLLDYEERNRDFFTPWVPERSDAWFCADAQDLRLHSELQEQRAQRSYRFFFALQSAPDLVIGDIGISNIVRGAFHSAYLGYKIDEAHQGHGYMREALQFVVRYAFEHLHLHRVEANIMPHNARSIALVEALGFRREGFSERYLCIHDRWEDHVRYALINEQYRSL